MYVLSGFWTNVLMLGTIKINFVKLWQTVGVIQNNVKCSSESQINCLACKGFPKIFFLIGTQYKVLSVSISMTIKDYFITEN